VGHLSAFLASKGKIVLRIDGLNLSSFATHAESPIRSPPVAAPAFSRGQSLFDLLASIDGPR
jgi:hypothetical protein